MEEVYNKNSNFNRNSKPDTDKNYINSNCKNKNDNYKNDVSRTDINKDNMYKRILGIDWGHKRIGIAVSDPSNKYALPKGFINNNSKTFENLKAIIKNNNISCIVVGLPLMLDGKPTFTSNKINKFIQKLSNYLSSQNIRVKIDTFNEMYTTNEAFYLMDEARVKRKKKKEVKDALSAKLILDGYLQK